MLFISLNSSTKKKSNKQPFLKRRELVKGQMVLTSSTGFYDGANHHVTFSNKVVLVDPNYSLCCNQLCCHTESENAYFQGNAKIIHQDNVLTSKDGNCLRPKKQLIFHQGTLTTKSIILTADCLEIIYGQDFGAIGLLHLMRKRLMQ